MPPNDISGSVIGVTLAKIDGIYEVDVTDARWSVKVPVPQHDTGAGVRNARGLEHPSCNFEKVVPRNAEFDWHARRQFSIEIYDIETRKKVVFASSGNDWENIDGSSSVGSAVTKKTISCKGQKVIHV